MKPIVNNVLELVGNTPLVRMSKIAPEGVDLLGKLESFNPGGSIKDRPCLQMIEDAFAAGSINSDSTIIEPTTGNTGIGLAMICAVKGLKCILTLPEDLSLERMYLLRHYGAEVVLTPARKGVQGAIDKAKELHQKAKNSFIPLQFKSEGNPKAHRLTTAVEIIEATEGRVDVFVAGVGTGGTITGIGEVLKKEIPGVKIVAVEPSASAVLSGKKAGKHRIQGIGAGFKPEILNEEIIDEIVDVSDEDAFQMMRRLGQEEGLSVGVSAGANVFASLKVAQKGQRVVTILCDTGDRYFTLEQFFNA